MTTLDHLVYAVPDLGAGVDDLERALGVRPAAGGRHQQWGTANALIALGSQVYLELVGPDPATSRPPTVFALDRLSAPRLVGWAARVEALAEGEERSRVLPDGGELRWRMTPPRIGLIPFLIDWGDSPHPADSAPTGVRLVSFRAESPAPDERRAALHALGLELEITTGVEERLVAVLAGRAGVVELS